MIERHYNLSCYVMEDLCSAEYSDFGEEVVNFIDSNHDVYEFRLAEHELYEKMAINYPLKQLKRIGQLILLLDTKGELIVRRRMDELYRFNGIDEVQILQIASGTIVILRSDSFYNRQQMELTIGFVDSLQKEIPQTSIHFETYNLEEQVSHHDHFQKYVTQLKGKLCKIEKIMGKSCVMISNQGERFIARLNLDKILQVQSKIIRYERLQFDFSQETLIIGSFKETLLLKKANQTYFIDCEQQKSVHIKEQNTLIQMLQYIIFNNFMISLIGSNLVIFETIKGNKMAEINIDAMLEQFQEGSSIVLKEQPKKEIRYCFLYDCLKNRLAHFYLLDKEKLSLYYFNINKLLERGFIKIIKENLKDLEEDNEKYHQNVMKTMNFRIKKLENLQNYLLEDLRNMSFGNTIRFLINEQNIYVLNDGLSMLYQAIITNLSKLMINKAIITQLQREIIKIGHRLVTESNYQNQISNGLNILNGLYTNLRKFQTNEGLEKNKQGYSKLLETPRLTKLLKSDKKKKKLFELSYQLALKIKGYKYLQTLQQKSK